MLTRTHTLKTTGDGPVSANAADMRRRSNALGAYFCQKASTAFMRRRFSVVT